MTINGYKLGLGRSGEFGYYTGNMSKVTSEGGATRRYEGWSHKDIFAKAEFMKVGIGENNNQINPWREAGDIYDDVTWIPGTVLPAAFEKGVRNFTNSSLARMTNSELYVMSKAAPFFRIAGNAIGGLGVVAVGMQGAWEYQHEGRVRTSTWVDVTASTILFAGSVIPGPWAPFFWGASAIYGGVRIFAGDEVDDYIDGN